MQEASVPRSPVPALSLAEVNALPVADFVRVFGPVLEHSPRYAERAADARPFSTLADLHAAFTGAILADDVAAQLALIRAHPDLAGKAARAGDLTRESASEQASAGLDRLTDEEYDEFFRLNAAYHERFGLPFVVCVRNHTRASILAQARERLGHTPDQERAAALREIAEIARHRLRALVREEG